MEEMPRKQYIPLVAFCLRHFLTHFIICMCEFISDRHTYLRD
ncbi:hypothetical protein SAMN05443247_03850 [Bradyrhizobium erythrophlei]|nr:hypothetical protein SAMN05443247_03850 [Bradyrhizobium erythrophlei]